MKDGKNKNNIEKNENKILVTHTPYRHEFTYNNGGNLGLKSSIDNSIKNEISIFDDHLHKIKRFKTKDYDHDQFYYFDTTGTSLCISGNKSHGIIGQLFKDTLNSLNEIVTLALINIGNVDGKVRYDVDFGTLDYIEVVEKKQISRYALEIKLKVKKHGRVLLNGFLNQYYKVNSSDKEVFQLNPFSLEIFQKDL